MKEVCRTWGKWSQDFNDIESYLWYNIKWKKSDYKILCAMSSYFCKKQISIYSHTHIHTFIGTPSEKYIPQR